WLTAQSGTIEIVSSELIIMESLVGPYKSGDTTLEAAFEAALHTDLRLLPVTQPIFRAAARLRATTRLKTPDAIHAATSKDAACTLFITNDVGYRGVPGLPIVI